MPAALIPRLRRTISPLTRIPSPISPLILLLSAGTNPLSSPMPLPTLPPGAGLSPAVTRLPAPGGSVGRGIGEDNGIVHADGSSISGEIGYGIRVNGDIVGLSLGIRAAGIGNG